MDMLRWLTLTALCFLSGCGADSRPNRLVVGMDLSYPPFETIDADGKPSGVSVEIAAALARDLNRELKIENIPFVGLIPALQTGRVDCVISSMTATPERAQSIDFSNPYIRTGLSLLVPSRSAASTWKDFDLERVHFVVRQGTTGEVWARQHLRPDQILAVEKENAAVLEVMQGNVDGFVYDQLSVWENAQKHPHTTRALLEPIQIEEWAIGIRKGDVALSAAINDFLARFQQDGGFEQLAEKYLSRQEAAFRQQNIPFIFGSQGKQ